MNLLSMNEDLITISQLPIKPDIDRLLLAERVWVLYQIEKLLEKEGQRIDPKYLKQILNREETI